MSYTATLQDAYYLGQDTALRNRLTMDLVSKANYVLAGGGSQTAPSLAFANAIVRGGPESFIAVFARQVALDTTSQGLAITGPITSVPSANLNSGAITDNQIDTVLSAKWTVLAGG